MLDDVRVVLDTDVMVAAFVSPGGASRLWLRAALRRAVRMLVSVPLMLEYEAVLLRPDIMRRARAQPAEVESLLDGVAAAADHVDISFQWRPSLSDPGDEMVLEAAVNGRADAILTFNRRDLAGAARFGIMVETPGMALTRTRIALR
ncbi:MAG: putative toxin-antitoxin system toxin component, PIN family [Alphaproteobacteria bacterium]|nr:putative toxin-antitoxin system toxin component, PIN family [Alphaproteobacteria bacterium]